MKDEPSPGLLGFVERMSWSGAAKIGCLMMAGAAVRHILNEGNGAFPAAWASAWAPALLLLSTVLGCGFVLTSWAFSVIEHKGAEVQRYMESQLRDLRVAQQQCLEREIEHKAAIQRASTAASGNAQMIEALRKALLRHGISTEFSDLGG